MKHEISTATNQHSVTPSTKMMEHPVVAHEASRPSTGNSNTEAPVTTNSAVTVEQCVDSLAHIGTRSGFPNVLVFLLSDALSIGLTLLSVRFIMQLCGFIDEMTLTSFRLMMGFYGLVLIAGWYQGLYSTVVIRPAAEMRVILLTSLGLAALFGILPMVIQLQQPESLAWLTCGALMLSLSQPALRAGSRLLFGRMPWWGRRVLLVGCGDRSASIYRMLKQSSVYGLRPVGFVEDYEALGAGDKGDKDGYLGPTAELAERVAEHDVNLALVATGGSAPRPEILNLVYQPNSAIGEWLIVADGMGGLPCLWTAAREVAGMPALGVANRLSSPWRRHLKRAIDLSIVLALLPLWLPMLGLLALIIRLTSPGKAFYSQQRLGLGSKTFRCWKLRSMVQNADEVLHEHLAKHPELLEEWKRDHKLKKDPRITWIGSFLRKTSLDELPQLFNVLKGDMSLVGPRPIVYAEIEKYGDVYKRYELVVPGITGLWQVNGRNNTSYEDRLAYDDYYVKNWSLSLDFYIMFCTIKVVLLREGAY